MDGGETLLEKWDWTDKPTRNKGGPIIEWWVGQRWISIAVYGL